MAESLSAHLSDEWPFKEKLKARLSRLKMKKSPYILWLVERDLDGYIPEAAATVLVDLAHAILGPVRAEDMATACEGVDQKREVYLLLERYIDERTSEKQKPRTRRTGANITPYSRE